LEDVVTERTKNLWTAVGAVLLFVVSLGFFLGFTERGQRAKAEIAAEQAKQEQLRNASIAKLAAERKRLQEFCQQPDGTYDWCVKLSSDPRVGEMAGDYLHRLAQEKRDRRDLGLE
jgi:hypothetical protein